MNMTHYMELLAVNQPWNLIFYMVIPVFLAEALVATEFFTVYLKNSHPGNWKKWNKRLGIVLGFYFLGIALQLCVNVIPSIQWRGILDVLAVGSYVSGVIPLLGISLLELGIIAPNKSEDEKMKVHFLLLIAFLIVSHIAMVFGMSDPTLLGWQPNTMEIYHHMK